MLGCGRLGELVEPAVACGARVWLVFDCSFGARGSGARPRSNVDRTRGGRLRERSIPCTSEEGASQAPVTLRMLGRRAHDPAGGACTVVTASTGAQPAHDVVADDGKPHGAFTLSLTRALHRLLTTRRPPKTTSTSAASAARVLADTREQLALLATAVDLPLYQVPCILPPENSGLLLVP